MTIFDVLGKISKELPGCISMSIVGLEDGLQLASVSRKEQDAAAIDAFQSDVLRVTRRALNELGHEGKVEGVVLSGDEMYFVSLPVSDIFFWNVVTDGKTTLGFTQALMRRHRKDIETALQDFFPH